MTPEPNRLVVLRIELDLTGRDATVHSSLVTYTGHAPTVLWTRASPLGDFGITPAPPYRLTVPADLVSATARSLADEARPDATVWIHLVPTYGLLGAVPWERELLTAARASVLRVPSRLPTPVVRGTLWLAAIAIDGGRKGDWAAPYVRSLVRHWQQAIPDRVEVDVFADARTTRSLRADADGFGTDGSVRVHDPRAASMITQQRVPRRSAAPNATTKLPPSSVGGSIWADWIADGLAGRAVRALHVVLDGSWDGGDPVLLVSHDPDQPTKRAHADMVGVTDLTQFVQTIGAATVSFGAPPHRRDEAAVRLFADTIGQQRSAATVFSSLADDPDGRWLAAAESFLVDPHRGRPLPRHPSLFAYVQPERLDQSWPSRERGLPDVPTPVVIEAMKYQEDSTLADRYAGSATVPSWVVSSDQFLGAQWASLARSGVSDVSSEPNRAAYDTGARDALHEIRAIVERHARPPS